jgi:hypothetical protein
MNENATKLWWRSISKRLGDWLEDYRRDWLNVEILVTWF